MAAPVRRTLLFVLTGLLLLAVWAGFSGDPQPQAAELPPVAESTEPPDIRRPVGGAAPVQREKTTQSSGGASDGRTVTVPGLTVRVVDPEERPVPGAEVSYHVRWADEEYIPEPRAERSSWAERALLADARGELRIDEPSDGSWTVYARHEGLWGVLYVPASKAEGTHVLQLKRDVTLRVQVVDAVDRPVVGVRVTLTNASDIDSRGGGGWHEPTEGPDGIATFAHVQQRVPEGWGLEGVVLLDFPLPQLVLHPVVYFEPPLDPIVLRLPGTGSVRVTLVDEGGRPFRPIQDDVYGRLYQISEQGTRSHWFHLPGAVLDLPHVGLGMRFHFVLDTEECRGSLQFAGPTRPGEHLALRLQVAVPPTISGRLLDERGVPQAGYWFATHVHPAPGWSNQYFETEENGLFHFALPEMPGQHDAPRSILFRRTLRERKEQALVELHRLELHGGRNDLGDVVLRAPPLLARGEVVDDRREPVAGAVLLVFQGDDDDRWAVPTLDEGDILSGQDGRFEIRGNVVTDNLLLRGEKGDAHGDSLPFSPGAEGLVYALPRTGRLEMKTECKGELNPRDLVFVLTDHSDGGTEGRAARYVLKDAVMSWGGLHPGRYDLEVRAIGVPDALASFDNLQVRGEETTRLPDLELGAELHTLEVHVTDSHGRPVPRANVLVDPDRTGDRPRATLTTTTGSVRVHAPRLPVELLVMAPGFRTRRVSGVVEDVTVALDEGLEVELRARVPEGFLAPDDQLWPEVRVHDPANPDPRPWRAGHRLYLYDAGNLYYPSHHPWLWRQDVPLDGNGRVRLRVPGPGVYSVRWRRQSPQRDEILHTSVPAVFRVEEGNGPTVVEVEIPR